MSPNPNELRMPFSINQISYSPTPIRQMLASLLYPLEHPILHPGLTLDVAERHWLHCDVLVFS